jgi:hypothetical protein
MASPLLNAPEPASYSDEDLEKVLLRVDPQRCAPERYKALCDEFAKRHGATIEGKTIEQYFAEARRTQPFRDGWTLRKRFLLILAGWGALMLVIRGLLYLKDLLFGGG